MAAFPGAFPSRRHAVLTGNPVRRRIADLPPPAQRFGARTGALRVLVLGGSQGARALNEAVPAAMAELGAGTTGGPLLWHQTGRQEVEAVRHRYDEAGVREARVEAFIDDMAAAYEWADLVICRAGALTVAEVAAAGLGAVLVPFPHAVDDHQARNAEYLVEAGAGVMLREDADVADRLRILLADLGAGEAQPDRGRLLAMAAAARGLAQPEAADAVARLCMEEAARA
jgi:UDP-N-acetylglucosamine--N-acetylmuramyl-(pentapeptide) pyrophosphoryl-undecaprenol N-acetylglucosamine transferase